MLASNYISLFKKLKLSEKFDFFERNQNSTLESLEGTSLNTFLKEIILDNEENNNIRKNALQTYINYTLLGRIKIRQTLTLLIDEWDDNCDLFLKSQRLKDLYLFYNEEEIEIENIYENSLKEEEAELIAESYFNLGLINMQKGFSSTEKVKILAFFEKSSEFFTSSNRIIENRVDSQFYNISILIIIDLIEGSRNILASNLKTLAILLFKKESFSFHYNVNTFHIGFYRVLNSLNIIQLETPNNWLNFRDSLSELYCQYAELTNQLIKERLNKSVISYEFKGMVKSRFIEPYFTLNFQAQLSKIDSRLIEIDSTNPEFSFLNDIRELVVDQKNKKVVESNLVKNTLTKIFPNRSLLIIEESISKIDTSNPFDYLAAFEDLKSPSIIEFTDKLIGACSKLQGNRIYRGGYSEDDRNTYITHLLESADYIVKDQSRWSFSAAGKSAGELDLFILDSKGLPYTIIEALNLDSLKKDYIIYHLDKLFKYDTTGLENNFIIVYSNSKNFDSFWVRYIEFISEHSYLYKFKSFKENLSYQFSDIKIGVAIHERKGKEVKLFHIMVDLFNS
ncbi:hypothetical protein QO200_05415 [Flavobacterium sp. Arc3]|jgi:hypothetical protein|uniref:hypothetical protein n=1 Tax=Flavobacterium sp. Arc3 TaxID=3046686 RepID=UPI00352D0306